MNTDALGIDFTEDIEGYPVDFIHKYVSKEEAEAEALEYAIREGIVPFPVSEYWMFGWKVTIGKHQYGDFVRLNEPVFDLAKPTLTEQARQVIKAKHEA